MKPKHFLLLLVFFLCLFTTAMATDIEIIGANVRFRREPKGAVLGRLSGGEVLPAFEETYRHGELWYKTYVPSWGYGYVSATYSRPVWEGERVFNPEDPFSPNSCTENVLRFYRELFIYLYEHDYCYWDEAEQIRVYRVKDGIGDASVVQPAHKWDLPTMLYRNGLLVESKETAALTYESPTEWEKERIASVVLKNHFGTDDLWVILLQRGLISYSELHGPSPITSKGANPLGVMAREVDEIFRSRVTTPNPDEPMKGIDRLYYNPNGGTRYHVDAKATPHK